MYITQAVPVALPGAYLPGTYLRYLRIPVAPQQRTCTHPVGLTAWLSLNLAAAVLARRLLADRKCFTVSARAPWRLAQGNGIAVRNAVVVL